jgi:hypothetical protein
LKTESWVADIGRDRPGSLLLTFPLVSGVRDANRSKRRVRTAVRRSDLACRTLRESLTTKGGERG